MTDFYITSAGSAFAGFTPVIGINSTTDKNYLQIQAMTTTDPDSANQLWTFVPVPTVENAFFLQNPATGLVIDIHGGNQPAGTRLDAYKLKDNYPTDWNNQMWEFAKAVEKGSSPLPFTYFILNNMNGLVVDIQKDNTTIDVSTKKTKPPDWNPQIWGFQAVTTAGSPTKTKAIDPPKWKKPPSQSFPPGFND